MNLPLLSGRLTKAYHHLNEIAKSARQHQSGGTLNKSSYEFYEECGKWAKEVQDAKELIDVRQSALTMVKNLPNSLDSRNPQNVLFQGQSIPFYHARLLALQSYIATAWAIYDSVSKVAGRLVCVDSVAKNEGKSPKLPEDFLGDKDNKDKDKVGARMHKHLKDSYGWPIGFSYAIRNWLLHNGNASDGVELFSNRQVSPKPYEIADDAWIKLDTKCRDQYKTNDTQTRRNESWPWHQDELEKLLEILQEEVDDAVGILILWAAESIKSQATLLLIRDT